MAIAALLVPIAARAQIAFVRHNVLYVQPCDGQGRRTGDAIRVCPLWKSFPDDGLTVGWTPNRKIVLTHYVDAWNGPKRFGLAQSQPVSGIWLVEPAPNAKPQRITEGFSPTFSPSGDRMIYASRNGDGVILERVLATGREKVLVPHAYQPILSKDGHLLAYTKVDRKVGYVEQVEVEDLRNGKLLHPGPSSVNPMELQFSLDNATLAVHFHLSRPLTGHSLLSLTGGRASTLTTPASFAPATIEDWSPDGKSVLLAWRVPDPHNDGNWTQQVLALQDRKSGHTRTLWSGYQARFTSDGRSVMYLVKPTPQSEVGTLMVRSLKPDARERVVAGGVSECRNFRR